MPVMSCINLLLPNAGGVAERQVSRAGYDVTPLTHEEQQAAAAELTDHQR